MTLLQKIMHINSLDEKEAKSLIMAGKVLVNEEIIINASHKIKDDDAIRIKETKKWVSRGAYKLLEALNKFSINVNGKVCLDVGSSTGGFSQVLLSNGANLVYALDSGTNQLDYKIRTNPKVISLEKTNLKSINENMFKDKIDILTCDVSFISVKHLFETLSNNDILSKDCYLIILIKPQFEANSSLIEEGGFVDEKYHQDIIYSIIDYAKNKNFQFLEITESPIKGNKSKNTEYLALFRKG